MNVKRTNVTTILLIFLKINLEIICICKFAIKKIFSNDMCDISTEFVSIFINIKVILPQ